MLPQDEYGPCDDRRVEGSSEERGWLYGSLHHTQEKWEFLEEKIFFMGECLEMIFEDTEMCRFTREELSQRVPPTVGLQALPTWLSDNPLYIVLR